MTFRVQVEDTVQSLETTKDAVGNAVRLGLQLMAAHALAQAKATTTFKDRTGKLRKSMRAGERGRWSTFVRAGGSPAPYAKFVEEGTRQGGDRYTIRARNAKFLRFEQNGKVVFRKSVRHPGVKPRRFMQSARDATEGVAMNFLEVGINSVLR